MDISLLGNGLRRSRKSLGLTQEQLAELLNVSSHYVYELEQGLKLPSLLTLVSAAGVLHTGIDSLLSPEKEAVADGDELSELLSELSPSERASLCRVLKVMLPNLRL